MTGLRMPGPVRESYAAEMRCARLQRHGGAVVASGAGAHPVPAVAVAAYPQPPGDARPGLSEGDRREAVGQLLRILVAAPGSVAGRYPHGNTSRTGAGLTRPMPVPADLATLLQTAAP